MKLSFSSTKNALWAALFLAFTTVLAHFLTSLEYELKAWDLKSLVDR